MMHLLVCCLLGFIALPVGAADVFKVKSDYLELHTGAGRGFPVTNVLEQGEDFTLLKKKYDWFKVQTTYGDKGWVSYSEFLAAAKQMRSNHRKRTALSAWQIGANAGIQGNDPLYNAYLNFYFAPQFALGAEIGQMAGTYSSALFYAAKARLSLWRTAVVSPVLDLGIGEWGYAPHKNLVDAQEHSFGFYKVSTGLMFVPYKRFALEVMFNSLFLQNQNVRLGGSLAASVFYD
ncbi:MAG: SH3 domain-containing protein [Gammaproteobacteria bacterium]|nr:SH3 domain-containing protein [Gammaproteobacteria bacterium]